ncbi:MAG TPA: 3-oxoadipate enol-lactonase [Roseiarcus sp.]|jgi:3-oxoadipate enol-lactonase
MKFVKANGLVVHVSDHGPRDAPPLVFINSLGTDFRIWTAVARILAPDFRIVLYDKRGHGLSESGPDQNDMGDYARDLAALLDRVGAGRATIVGLSIGGVIAQEFYRQRPEHVAALVLCDTAAKIGTDEIWDQRMAEVERGGIEAIADSVLERWFTAAFRSERTAELAGMRAMLTRTPKEGYLAACWALKRADLRPYAGRIEAPTLCLVGDEDGSTPVSLVRETAALIPASRFEVIAGAGHIPNVEKPKIVAGLIAEHARRAAS